MIRAAPALAVLLAGCATLPSAPPGAPDGIVRHYIRSNQDGSETENIVHFRPSRTDVAVYKWMSKCNGAAFVTAQLDPVAMEPLGLDAGKVARDGGQATFGRLTLDPASRKVSARVDLPSGPMADDATMPAGMPWFLFDYDMGDLNAYLQDKRPQGDFWFAFGLVWPDSADFLTHLATIHVAHRGLEPLGARQVRRFDLHFTAGKAGEGVVLTDPASGAIVEARVSLPNHPGMKDYKLALVREEPGGRAAWERLLKGHYANCPA